MSQQAVGRKSASWWSALLAVTALLALVAVGLRHIGVPAPSGAGATGFSSARAMRHVERLARAPHAVGTAEHAQVRAYLLEQIKALGYVAQVQSGTVVSAKHERAAQVSNIVLRIPGRAPGKALMLVAHYDTAPSSPGAADDSASVSAILETLQVLKAQGPLQNDLIVLLSDGEEIGSMGAQLFMEQAARPNPVGMVLNFEFRGNSGPIWMFETSAGNGKLIEEWSKAVAHPLGSSLLYELYRLMPNDTDMSVFKAHGTPGMNFAAGDGFNSYHSELDTVKRLDQGSVQHLGDIMLALTRHFGNRDLNHIQADNRIYFDLPAFGVVSYPALLALPLCLLWLALFGWVTVRAMRVQQVGAARIGLALLAMLLSCAVVAAACQALWMLLTIIHPGYALLPHGNTYNGTWYLAAFSALAVGLFAAIMGRLERRFKPLELTLGALLLASLVLIATSLALPGASFLFFWPSLPVLLALLWLLSARGQALSAGMRLLVLVAAAAPGVLIFTPLMHLLYTALTQRLLGISVLVLMLFLGMLAPVLQALRQRFVLPFLPLVASLALLLGGALSSGFDPAHPQPSSVFYAENPDAGAAYWLSDSEQLDGWNRQFFSASPKQAVVKEVFGVRAPPLWAQPAPASHQAAPVLTLVEDRSDGALRSVTLEIASARRAPKLLVFVDNIAVQSSTVQGRPFTSGETAHWRLEADGMASQALQVRLNLKPGQPFNVRVRDVSYELPASAVQPRPAAMMVEPLGRSDTTQLTRIMQFKPTLELAGGQGAAALAGTPAR
ncbi:M28 family peptidase [Rugamonas sp. CCM 8940]|uniref:M28 family peptidase n=1 Tax=Rugamonas sp. CCM 8940 TaxID=2765359 RepID=UPI0018F38D06|nr:M28 family peptidase [Rugamonas sp. CCM 8940]MBJ7312366.1 M28 family peptidase [Rugamonas sp. CCM 8940]